MEGNLDVYEIVGLIHEFLESHRGHFNKSCYEREPGPNSSEECCQSDLLVLVFYSHAQLVKPIQVGFQVFVFPLLDGEEESGMVPFSPAKHEMGEE